VCRRLQVGSIEEHRLVGREVAAVVLQDPQVVVGDLRVGAVEVDDVEIPGGEAPIGEIVIQSAHSGLRKAVGAPEPRPAVGAVHKLVAEAEAQLRMGVQIRNPSQAQALGKRTRYAERIGVVEAE